MKEEWGFLDSGFHDAAINMALDEALLNWHRNGDIPPTVRFYGWKVPTLSVGRFQNAEKTINFNMLRQYGYQYVRRLTGGSAVLHDDELTYSIIISESHPTIPVSVREAYYILSQGILEGYKNLGIYADYAMPKEKPHKNESGICFEKTAYYEMIVNGRKISGNAQTRKKGVLLQHGSIPMSIDTNELFDMFHFSTEEKRNSKQQLFSSKATTINQLTKRTHTFSDLKKSFFKGFQKGLNITLKPLVLSPQQWDDVYQLADEKYETAIKN